ncbi:MAG: MATE family efflux transporter [Ruminococcaceae bacterium]|nr:MATE family efflux transporter [Oscillospiraceae bacterium]
MARVTDMTVGNPTKLLVGFALPMMFGNLFQQMYSLVDTLVVGRGVGVNGLSAVGSAGWLDWFFLGNIMGLMQGFMVLISQRFGAEDLKGMRKAVAMSIYLAIAATVLFTTVALLTARPILEILKTPDATIDMSHSYIRIVFMGIPIIVIYNLLASILRALGNSKVPLVAIIIASVMNIGLDVLFVIGFKWGVVGAAAATVTSQLFSAVFCFIAVLRVPQLKMEAEDFRPDWPVMGRLLKLGLPLMFNSFVISVGGLVVQYIVNGFGPVFVAAVTAANRVCGLMEQAGVSVATAAGTFTGQNYGAKKFDRIRQGVNRAMMISVSIAWILGAIVAVFARPIIRFFVEDEPEVVEQVVDMAHPYMLIICGFLWMLYLLYVYRTSLQGMGDSITPFVSGIIELIFRIGIVLALTRFVGEYGVYFAEVSAWAGAAVLLVTVYYFKLNKLCPRGKKSPEAGIEA